MKKLVALLGIALFIFPVGVFAGRVDLTTYYPASRGEYESLEANGTLVPPRYTTAARDALGTGVPEGAVIYNLDTQNLETHTGSGAWTSGSASSSLAAWTGGYVANTNYLAATNGFVVASVQTDNNDGILTGYTDASATPTTIVASSGIASLSNFFASNLHASIMFPVRRGDYWRVILVSGGSGAVFAIRWIPLS